MKHRCIQSMIRGFAMVALALGLSCCQAERYGTADKTSSLQETGGDSGKTDSLQKTDGATHGAKTALVNQDEMLQEPSPQSKPLPLLPDRFMDAWVKDGPALHFSGADLYGHIDGGAEVFLELGFENLEVQRYKKDDDSSDLVDVEIYWMTDPEAALGVYLLHFGREERIPDFAPRHTANRYQIQFFLGNAYVKINNPKTVNAAGRALPDFARYVTDRLPHQKGFIPAMGLDPFRTLPTPNRIEGSERIIRGPFTLERIILLGSGDMLQLNGTVTALAADYHDEGDETYSRIVAIYPGSDDRAGSERAHAAFEHFCDHLDAHITPLKRGSDTMVFKDYSDRFGSIECKGDRIDLIVNKASNPMETEAAPSEAAGDPQKSKNGSN